MRVLLPAILAASLTACATTADVPDAPPPMAGGGTCDAAGAQRHVGQTATQEVGNAILADSGARSLRWGPPNSAWTMDYREDRVNARYDAAMKITDITCG